MSLCPRYYAVIAALALTVFLPQARTPALAQMPGGMREMMRRMVDDVVPPGINLKLSPDNQSRGARLLEQCCSQ